MPSAQRSSACGARDTRLLLFHDYWYIWRCSRRSVDLSVGTSGSPKGINEMLCNNKQGSEVRQRKLPTQKITSSYSPNGLGHLFYLCFSRAHLNHPQHVLWCPAAEERRYR
jgi:hypothetical protein